MVKTEKLRISNISMPFTDTALNAKKKSAKKFKVIASGEQETEIMRIEEHWQSLIYLYMH